MRVHPTTNTSYAVIIFCFLCLVCCILQMRCFSECEGSNAADRVARERTAWARSRAVYSTIGVGWSVPCGTHNRFSHAVRSSHLVRRLKTERPVGTHSFVCMVWYGMCNQPCMRSHCVDWHIRDIIYGHLLYSMGNDFSVYNVHKDELEVVYSTITCLDRSCRYTNTMDGVTRSQPNISYNDRNRDMSRCLLHLVTVMIHYHSSARPENVPNDDIVCIVHSYSYPVSFDDVFQVSTMVRRSSETGAGALTAVDRCLRLTADMMGALETTGLGNYGQQYCAGGRLIGLPVEVRRHPTRSSTGRNVRMYSCGYSMYRFTDARVSIYMCSVGCDHSVNTLDFVLFRLMMENRERPAYVLCIASNHGVGSPIDLCEHFYMGLIANERDNYRGRADEDSTNLHALNCIPKLDMGCPNACAIPRNDSYDYDDVEISKCTIICTVYSDGLFGTRHLYPISSYNVFQFVTSLRRNSEAGVVVPTAVDRTAVQMDDTVDLGMMTCELHCSSCSFGLPVDARRHLTGSLDDHRLCVCMCGYSMYRCDHCYEQIPWRMSLIQTLVCILMYDPYGENEHPIIITRRLRAIRRSNKQMVCIGGATKSLTTMIVCIYVVHGASDINTPTIDNSPSHGWLWLIISLECSSQAAYSCIRWEYMALRRVIFMMITTVYSLSNLVYSSRRPVECPGDGLLRHYRFFLMLAWSVSFDICMVTRSVTSHLDLLQCYIRQRVSYPDDRSQHPGRPTNATFIPQRCPMDLAHNSESDVVTQRNELCTRDIRAELYGEVGITSMCVYPYGTILNPRYVPIQHVSIAATNEQMNFTDYVRDSTIVVLTGFGGLKHYIPGCCDLIGQCLYGISIYVSGVCAAVCVCSIVSGACAAEGVVGIVSGACAAVVLGYPVSGSCAASVLFIVLLSRTCQSPIIKILK